MKKLITVLFIICVVSSESIINMNVVTYLTVDNHLVKGSHIITFTNKGSDPEQQYTFIEDSKNPLLGCFDQFESKLTHRENFDNDSLTKYTVTLSEEVKPKEVSTITCHVLLVNKLKARRKAIFLNDDSTAVLETNILFPSLYETVLYKLYLTFESPADEVYSENKNVQRKDNVLSFSFSNLKPLSFEISRFVFKYNKPMFVVRSLVRKIHLSMYGKIFIEDNVVIQNRASRRLGDFHSVFFTTKVLKTLSTFLPASAENIKYFDILGNNSASSVIYSTDYVTLKHQPRYPLLGGWQYTYIIQYYVPVYEYVFTDNQGSFFLQMRAIDHVVSNTFIEEAITKVCLPEFASIAKVTVPKKFSRRKDEISHETLSIFGNPTVVFNGSYLIEEDIYPFMIKFNYDKYFALSTVILITVYVESFFLLYLMWRKFFM